MAGELLQKLEKLRDIINKKNNEAYCKDSVELLNPMKVDEDVTMEEINAEMEVLSIEKELRKSISEEEDAIQSYLGRAKKALAHGDEVLYVLYKEIASDEIVHAAQLKETLEILGLIDKTKELKGRMEAYKLLCPGINEAKEDEGTKKQRQLREKADKTAKNFDFVAEYTKGRLEQAKQKVVSAINDLIIGKEDLEGTLEKILKDGKKIIKPSKDKKKTDKKEVEKETV